MAGPLKASRPRTLGLGRDLLGLFISLAPECKLDEGRGFRVLFITASPALTIVAWARATPSKELLNQWLLPSPPQCSAQAVVRTNK